MLQGADVLMASCPANVRSGVDRLSCHRVHCKPLSGSLRAETPVFDEDQADPLNLIRVVPA